MPHIIVDYSRNLDEALDMQGFCDHLLKAAQTVAAFPNAGIRVRAVAADHYAIADGNPAHAYVDISIRLRGGRSAADKSTAVETIFSAAKDYMADYMAARPLALSLELRDIDPALSPKTGTIRDHLKD